LKTRMWTYYIQIAQQREKNYNWDTTKRLNLPICGEQGTKIQSKGIKSLFNEIMGKIQQI
jgi:hypothetical protein